MGRTAYFIGRAVCVRLRRLYAGKFVKFAPFNCLARVLRTFYVGTHAANFTGCQLSNDVTTIIDVKRDSFFNSQVSNA